MWYPMCAARQLLNFWWWKQVLPFRQLVNYESSKSVLPLSRSSSSTPGSASRLCSRPSHLARGLRPLASASLANPASPHPTPEGSFRSAQSRDQLKISNLIDLALRSICIRYFLVELDFQSTRSGFFPHWFYLTDFQNFKTS